MLFSIVHGEEIGGAQGAVKVAEKLVSEGVMFGALASYQGGVNGFMMSNTGLFGGLIAKGVAEEPDAAVVHGTNERIAIDRSFNITFQMIRRAGLE